MNINCQCEFHARTRRVASVALVTSAVARAPIRSIDPFAEADAVRDAAFAAAESAHSATIRAIGRTR